MMVRMLKNELKRNRIITAALCGFIMLAAMLVSGAVSIIVTLSGSMDALLENADAPHFSQLHAGELEQDGLDRFVREHNRLIQAQQTVELLGINGANLYIGDREQSEAGSLMENSFVRQNRQFDYLLDTDNQVLQISDGEIAVPVYHMQRYNLQTGDKVRVADGDFVKDFTIVAFLRDSLMNPSMINSKRFLVSDGDWELLHTHLGEIEYLIEFQLYDTAKIRELETLYQNSDLPRKGAAMGYSLVKVINGMSDGIAASLIILIACLLVLIAALCLRFTMLTTIEEDYREIGVMKALGISGQDIRKLYLVKYIVISAVSCGLGYFLALSAGNLFTANISLYMGAGGKTVWNRLLPAAGAGMVFAAILMICMAVLRRFRRISAQEALRFGTAQERGAGPGKRTLSGSRIKDVNLFLGVKEVSGRFRIYGLLCFVYVLCAFLMIVPSDFYHTLVSPGFISYMGAGKCDLRLDLQYTPDLAARYEETEEYLKQDADVAKYAALFTGIFKVPASDGTYDNIKVETGEFNRFPLEYIQGSAPQKENEIALSVMYAKEYQKKPGDSLTLMVGNGEREMTVCGIYQDVTNGGKTAKAILPMDMEQVVWFTVNIDLKEGVSPEEKRTEYRKAFHPAKVTDVTEYVDQTLGGVTGQLRLVVKSAFLLALAVAALITGMYFKMLMTKEARQTAVMKSLGFTDHHIMKQYYTRAALILAAGVVCGTFAANLLGEKLAGLVIPGIPEIKFVGNPWYTWCFCPLALMVAVTAALNLCRQTVRNIRVMQIVQ